MVKHLTTQIGQVHTQGVQYQKKTDSHLQHQDNQNGQINTSLSNIVAQLSGKLPSQPIPNPKENAKAITLKSGKELGEPKGQGHEIEKELEIEPKSESEGDGVSLEENEGGEKVVSNNEEKSTPKRVSNPSIIMDKPPFPSRFAKSRKKALDHEILETFRKAKFNIPLLDAIKQVARYSKFLKELCTNKKQFRSYEKVSMGKTFLL